MHRFSCSELSFHSVTLTSLMISLILYHLIKLYSLHKYKCNSTGEVFSTFNRSLTVIACSHWRPRLSLLKFPFLSLLFFSLPLSTASGRCGLCLHSSNVTLRKHRCPSGPYREEAAEQADLSFFFLF